MTLGSGEGYCPACQSEFSPDDSTAGLCPVCLLTLGQTGRRGWAEGTGTLEGGAGIERGSIIADRYRVDEPLGRGGMGEVWRAFDLRLRMDVALKATRSDRYEDEGVRERLRQEVRSARSVVSQNVCRIFDLAEENGREYVSMELVDGSTLTDVFGVRGPLSMAEAWQIASQFLAGLEAVHAAGLVHRDLKPDNVMLTRSGRVVIMDLGLAEPSSDDPPEEVSGTVAYMAPEQIRGEAIDARADLFSAGVVLVEMLTVAGKELPERAEHPWNAVHEVPPRVPPGPWAAVLRKALAVEPEDRYPTARALHRALEASLLGVPESGDTEPYPGLAAFSADDAPYFHGRESMTEAVLARLERPRLLALVGPSGAGKTSFVRAGLIPAIPRSWRVLVTSPGARPLQSLSRELAPALLGDLEVYPSSSRLPGPDDVVSLVTRWRRTAQQALIVLDQFEELFALNPPAVQEVVASVVGRLVLEADTHVLIVVREDFLLRCSEHEALRPAFSELIPMGSLDQRSIRRALVQPALSCGYRFEDEALVDEIVADVAGSRGLLPLLAFAASQLWARRDRDLGLLTRRAYEQIGGVAGALVGHAEATVERIGEGRLTLVQEVFRDLVTAHGTRISREREELLSSLGPGERKRAAATTVVDELVAARLLTEYEGRDDTGRPRAELEIAHESLLSRWPRLVRWQMQDADALQLRDQVRQAAQLWDHRGRPEDLLWSGRELRDLQAWHGGHVVGLSGTEEAFVAAATHRAARRHRLQRSLAAGAITSLVIGSAAIGYLGNRAIVMQRAAEDHALRAEASKTLALAELEADRFPSAAMAYVLRSLELVDTREARLLAVKLTQVGPLAVVAPASQQDGLEAAALAFSHDGRWLALGGQRKVQVRRRDGGEPVVLLDSPVGMGVTPAFGPDEDTLVVNDGASLSAWSVARRMNLWNVGVERGTATVATTRDSFFTRTEAANKTLVRRWWFDGRSRVVASLPSGRIGPMDVCERWVVFAKGDEVVARSISGTHEERMIGKHAGRVIDVRLHPTADRVAASDDRGEVRIWSLLGRTGVPLAVLPAEGTPLLVFAPDGRWLAAAGTPFDRPTVRLFDLTAPFETRPIVATRGDVPFLGGVAFDPGAPFFATTHVADSAVWRLPDRAVRVLDGSSDPISSLVFTPDGRAVVSGSSAGEIALWPMSGADRGTGKPRVLARTGVEATVLSMDPQGDWVAAPAGDHVILVSLKGQPARRLGGFSDRAPAVSVSFSPSGRRLAAAPIVGEAGQKLIHIFDLQTGEVSVAGPAPGATPGYTGGLHGLTFLNETCLIAGATHIGLVRFDLSTGTMELLNHDVNVVVGIDRASRVGFGIRFANLSPLRNELLRFSLHEKRTVRLRSHGDLLFPWSAAVDLKRGRVASGDQEGVIRVGTVDGEEPHYLFGHQGPVWALALSPDGRWLASGGADRRVRLWPLADVSTVPLQKRSRPELLSVLKTLTNLRAVADPGSPSGYRVAPVRFPGWGPHQQGAAPASGAGGERSAQ